MFERGLGKRLRCVFDAFLGRFFKLLRNFDCILWGWRNLKLLYLCWLRKCLDSGYTANLGHKSFCLFTLSFLLLLLFPMCFLVLCWLAPLFCLSYWLICAVSMAIFRLMIKVLASVRDPGGFRYFSTGSSAYPRPLHGPTLWLAAFGRSHNNVIECRHCDKVELPGT